MSETNREELSRDLVFDILSSPRRRYMLYYLHRAGDPVSIQELSARIAAWENDVPVDELTSQQQKRVYVSLYQTHIPKLEEAGIAEYDQEEGTVRLTSRVEQMDEYLADSDERAIPWELIYLGLALVSTALFLGVAFEVGALATVSLIAVGIAVSVAFGLVALAHAVSAHRSSRGRSLARLEEDER